MATTEYDKILGARLRYRITVAGLTDEEVADQLGIAKLTIYRHCKGAVKVSAETASRYAQLFGIPTDELLPRLDSNQQPAGYGMVAA